MLLTSILAVLTIILSGLSIYLYLKKEAFKSQFLQFRGQYWNLRSRVIQISLDTVPSNYEKVLLDFKIDLESKDPRKNGQAFLRIPVRVNTIIDLSKLGKELSEEENNDDYI